MKIINLQAENIKRLIAIEIATDGNVVEITGKNEAGKSSVLDAIWWALAGASSHQEVPIRIGESHATIRLDLGEIIVRREFLLSEGGDKVATRLFVESTEGARFPSPQRMLDELVGSLAFNPMAFILADTKDQYEQLKKFVTKVDLEAEEQAYTDDYSERREQNRIVKAESALAYSEDPLPEDLINLDAIQKQLDERQKANESLEAQRRAAAELVNERNRAVNYVKEIQEDIDRIKEQIERRQKELANWAKARDEAGAALAKVEIPDSEPIKPLVDELTSGARINEKVKHAILAEVAMKKSEGLTNAMEIRSAAILKAISESDMPVKGLMLKDKRVYLDDLPLDQASTAKKMDLAFRVAMAENPKLRVVFFRDASLLDDEHYQQACKLADEHDCQVWVERVDASGKMGFVIEDGMIKDHNTRGSEVRVGEWTCSGCGDTFKKLDGPPWPEDGVEILCDDCRS